MEVFMKYVKKPLSLLISILMIVSMLTVIPISASAETEPNDLILHPGDGLYRIPITEVGTYTVESDNGDVVSVDVVNPYIPGTSSLTGNPATYVASIPINVTSSTNLYPLLKAKHYYQPSSSWNESRYAVTIPVKPGERIYSNAFYENNGIRTTFFGDGSGEKGEVYTLTPTDTKKKFTEDSQRLDVDCIEVPTGYDTYNVGWWNDVETDVIYLLDAPKEEPCIKLTPGSLGSATVTVKKDGEDYAAYRIGVEEVSHVSVRLDRDGGTQRINVREAAQYDVSSDDNSIVSVDVVNPYIPNESSLIGTQDESKVASIPLDVTCDTNLYPLLKAKNFYTDSGTWNTSYWSVIIPVHEGEKVYSNSFFTDSTDNTKAQAIRTALFGPNGAEKLGVSETKALHDSSTADTGVNCIKVPTGYDTFVIPFWPATVEPQVYLLDAPSEKPGVYFTPNAEGTASVTTYKVIDGNLVSDIVYDVTVASAENDSMELNVGESAVKALPVDGTYTYTSTGADNVTVEFMEAYEKGVSNMTDAHLSELPDVVSSETNLWSLNKDGYFTESGEWSTTGIKSVTIPVKPGDRITSNSMGAVGTNGDSTRNGIRVTFFNDDTVIDSMGPSEVYSQYCANNNSLIVPEGANTVNVPFWSGSSPSENYLYILNANAERCVKFTGKAAGKSTVTINLEGMRYGVYQIDVVGSIAIPKDSQYTIMPSTDGLTWSSSDTSVVSVAMSDPYVPATSGFDFTTFGYPTNSLVDLTQYAELTPTTNLYTGNVAVKAIRAAGTLREDATPSVTIPVHPGDRIVSNSMGPKGENGGSQNGIRLIFLNDNDIVANWSTDITYNKYLENNGCVIVPNGVNTAHVMFWGQTSSNYLYILNTGTYPVITAVDAGDATVSGSADGDVVERYNVTVADSFEPFYTAVVGTDLVVPSTVPVTSVTSSRTAIATASTRNNDIIVKPLATGDTTVTVTYSGGITQSFDVYTYASQAKYNYLNSVFKGKKISILGDSISTLDPYSNDYGVPRYYDKDHYKDGYNGDATIPISLKDTYWGNIIRRFDAELGVSETWRGTCVAESDQNRAMDSDKRIGNLDNKGTPDVILFYGGTNDVSNNSITPESFATHYNNALTKMKAAYPNAKIIAILPCQPSGCNDYNAVAIPACKAQNVEYINLWDSGVRQFHPDANGFSTEVSYILDTMYEDYINSAAEINGVRYATLQAAVDAAYAGDTITLLEDVDESLVIDAKTAKNRSSETALTIDLNGNTITNTPGYHTLFIKKGAEVVITDSGENGTIDNITDNYAAIINNGKLTVEDGIITRSGGYYNSVSDKNAYYAVWNRGDMTINGGTFTSKEGYASLIDNGWNATSYSSTSKIDLADGTQYLYGYSEDTAYENPTLVINGGTLTNGHHVVNNDMFGHLTVNGGTLTQNLFSPQVFSTAIYNTGEGAVTKINSGTITCTNEDETIDASYGTSQYFDTVHYFAVFTTNENNAIGNGAFSIEGGTINGRIGAGSDYAEWVAEFRKRPGQAVEVTDNAKLEVSGGSFDRAVPEQYCADGYVPSAIGADGRYTVVPGTFAAEVNGTRYTTVQAAIDAAGANDTVKLFANVTESVIFEADDKVTFDLNGNKITNTAKNHTLFIKKGAEVVITDSGENGTIDNITDNYAAIINNGKLTVEDGIITRSGGYYNSVSDKNAYYAVWNRGDMTINGGTFTSKEGYASLIDNGWNATSYSSTSKIDLADGTQYLYGYSEDTAYENPTLVINGGTLTNGHHVVNNDMFGHLTVNGGTLTQNLFSPQVFSTAIYNTGEGAVTKINSGTITCTNEDETIDASYGTSQYFDTVHYFAVFTTNENNAIGNGAFSIEGGTINGRIGAGSDYAEWVAEFRKRPGQAVEVTDSAKLEVSGGSFDRAVPEQYCADGYVPTAIGSDGRYTVVPGTFVAEVNGTRYTTVQAAIDAAGANDTVKLLSDVTESVLVKADDSFTLDLNGFTLTNEAFQNTVAVMTGGSLEIVDNGDGGQIINTDKGYAALFNNGIVDIASGTLTRTNATEEDTYYVVENHGTLTISGGTFSNADNCRASLIDNGYANYDSTKVFTAGGEVFHYGYVEGEGLEHPTLTITGGNFYGGRHVINNDVKGVATISDGYFESTTSTNATYASKADVINNIGVLTISGGEFKCVGNSQYVVANIVNQDNANATPVRIAADPQTSKYSDGIVNVTGGKFTGKLYAQLDAQNEAGEKADLNVSGGSFSDVVPADYCADGYVPSAIGADGRYTVVPGTFVAEVNGTRYTTVQAAIDAAGANDTVKLLLDVTESVLVKADDSIKLDLNGFTLTNEAFQNTVVVATNGTLNIVDNGDGGQIINTDKGYAALFNNGIVDIASGTLTRTNATEEDTYYVVENHGTLTISGGTFSNADNCRASLIDNGYANYDSTKVFTAGGEVFHYGYFASEGLEHPTLTITGGKFYGGRHVINNDVKGVATINDGYFESTTSENPTYSSKADVINNIGVLTIAGGEFKCVRNSEYVIANIVNQDNANATPVRIAADPQTSKYSDGIVNVTGGKFTGKLYAQLDAQNEAGEKADLNVSGGSFSEVVPADYCADGYVPVTTKDEDGMYTVKPATYVAEVDNGTQYTTVQAAIDAANGGTVTLLKDVTESVVVSDSLTLTLDGHTMTNEPGMHTIVVLNTCYIQINGNGTIINNSNHCAAIFNNGTLDIDDISLTRSDDREDNTYYVIENHGMANIYQATVTNEYNCRASLIDNGYANYESTATFTTKTGETLHYGYHEGEAMYQPILYIGGGTFKGGRHVINNDIHGYASIEAGSFYVTKATEGTYLDKADVINNVGRLRITGGFFINNNSDTSGIVVANIVNQDDVDATPVRHAADPQTSKYSEGIVNISGETGSCEFVGELYSQTKAQNVAGNTADMNVSGGGFSEIVPVEYCADGYLPTTNFDYEPMFTVVPNTIKYTATLTLQDSIDINLYVQDIPDGTNPTDYTVYYSFNDTEGEATLANPDSNQILVASCAAKEMKDNVQIEVYYLGRMIKKVDDYSVERYCLKKIKESESEELKDLCKSVLDYGMTAQEYFEYRAAEALEGTYYSKISDIIVPDKYNLKSEGECSAVKKLSATLSLESYTEMNFYITPADNHSIDELTVTLNGENVKETNNAKITTEITENGALKVTVKGIAAKDLDKELTLKVSADGCGERTIVYSPLTYAYRNQNNSNNMLANNVKALYNYYLTADEYFKTV